MVQTLGNVMTLLDLGNGMNGHPNVCHGGFVATMLDEILGVLVQLVLEKKLKSRLHEGGNVFTACKCIVTRLRD